MAMNPVIKFTTLVRSAGGGAGGESVAESPGPLVTHALSAVFFVLSTGLRLAVVLRHADRLGQVTAALTGPLGRFVGIGV